MLMKLIAMVENLNLKLKLNLKPKEAEDDLRVQKINLKNNGFVISEKPRWN